MSLVIMYDSTYRRGLLYTFELYWVEHVVDHGVQVTLEEYDEEEGYDEANEPNSWTPPPCTCESFLPE
jgi:hypothetical protein